MREVNPKFVQSLLEIICGLQSAATNMATVYYEHSYGIVDYGTLVGVYAMLEESNIQFHCLIGNLIQLVTGEREPYYDVVYRELLRAIAGEEAAAAIIRGEWLNELI